MPSGSTTRKHGRFTELTVRQNFDILWFKVPLPAFWPDRHTVRLELGAGYITGGIPSSDGQLQTGFTIPKGTFKDLPARGSEAWTAAVLRHLSPDLAAHLRAHAEAVERTVLLYVVVGRLTEWTAPGLLLLGDAAHPMSPIGGQGINLALRDALVAANHLCPVLSAGGDPSAIDAATRRARDERWPEVVTVQQLQEKQGSVFFNDHWGVRLMFRLLPLLMRTGALQWLQRKEKRLMADGVVPVRLVA